MVEVHTFEDQDLSPYTTGLAGNGSVDIQSNTVIEGSWAFLASIEGQGDEASAWSTSGLSNYPAPDQVITFAWRTSSADTPGKHVMFGWTNNQSDPWTGDGYKFVQSTASFYLQKYSGGNVATQVELGFQPSASTWYIVEIDWHYSSSGDITATVYDTNDNQQATGTILDAEYGEGGILMSTEDVSSAKTPNDLFIDNWTIDQGGASAPSAPTNLQASIQ